MSLQSVENSHVWTGEIFEKEIELKLSRRSQQCFSRRTGYIPFSVWIPPPPFKLNGRSLSLEIKGALNKYKEYKYQKIHKSIIRHNRGLKLDQPDVVSFVIESGTQLTIGVKFKVNYIHTHVIILMIFYSYTCRGTM